MKEDCEINYIHSSLLWGKKICNISLMKGYGSLVNFCCEKWLKWLTCLLNMVLGWMIMLIIVVWMAVGRERHLELELGLNSALLITVLYFYFCCCCLSWLYRPAGSPVSSICFGFFCYISFFSMTALCCFSLTNCVVRGPGLPSCIPILSLSMATWPWAVPMSPAMADARGFPYFEFTYL